MLAKLFINYYNIVFIIIIILAYYNIIYVIGHFFLFPGSEAFQPACMQAPLFATYAGDRVLLILLCK